MNKPKKQTVTGKAVDASVIRKIFRYVLPFKKIFIFSAFVSIVLALIAPVRPWLVQYTIDNYIAEDNSRMLLVMTVVLLVMLLFESVLQFGDTYLQNWIGQQVIKKIRVDLYRHIINLRLKYFDNTPIGMLVTRAVSDIETISDIFSDGLVVIIGDILKLSVIIVLMFFTDVKLTLISLSTIPILLVSANMFKNGVKKAFQEVRTQVARLNTFVQEHITGINIIQIFNREEVEYKKFEEINAAHRDANIRSIWYYSVFFPVVEILSSVSIGLLIWWGGRGVFNGTSSLGEIVAFIMYVQMMFRPIRQLADRFNTLQMGMVGSERVFKVLETNETIVNEGTYITPSIKGKIEFKNVSFAYNEENYILKNVSFSVEPSQALALVGETGSGKSSIINLVNRFYEYNSGEILLDDKNIRDYELHGLRNHIAIVLQDVFLFSDSIHNNITLNNPAITRKQVEEAATAIGAHNFIVQLPGGYDYNVMERGAMLSVGQRQLISFIRAYVHNPGILILDEATSSVDSESERMIQYALDKLMKGRTSITVAHRLATIQKADIILVLNKGEIVESGNHSQLFAKSGYYRKLFEAQFMKSGVGV